MPADSPTGSPTASATDSPIASGAVGAEVARLRQLVGPDEQSYQRLRADIGSMRQATIAAEERLGIALAQIKQLEAELAHSYRNTVLVYKKVLRPIYLCFRWIPGVRQLAAHVKR